MTDPDDLARATELWQEAYRHQMRGELDLAIEGYWAMSFQGRLEEATQECLRAIAIDPDFGNPYNDIGVYLMQQGKLDEAIPWLERAKQATRYEPRQFPFMNLARIYVKRGRWWDALREFEGAVRMAPTDTEARRALHGLRARLN